MGSNPQSKLQFGFTEEITPIMAALLLSEATAESRDLLINLLAETLDSEKAFDVVSHPKLFLKLNDVLNDNPILYNAIVDMYDGMSEKVIWAGKLSREFLLKQGVGQGKILSPDLYKLYINKLLEILESSGNGFHIGINYAGSPTCADDVLLLESKPSNLQELTTDSYEYSKDHRFNLHPTKSEVASRISRSKDPYIKLGATKVPHVTSIKHLGLERDLVNNKLTINSKIESSRKATYQLLPAGLYGEHGVSMPAAKRLIISYTVPTLLYGVESLILTGNDIKEMDTFFKSILRNVLALREGTATEALYILSGILPIESMIHTRMLTLYGNIARLSHDHPLKCIARRQLVIKKSNSHSWFTQAIQIARKYEMESEFLDQLITPMKKKEWKTFIKNRINTYWWNMLTDSADSKSSLCWLDLDFIGGQAHHIYPNYGCSSRMRVAAATRAKFISGSFILQSTRSRFNQFKVDPTCPLCGYECEDLPHMLLECPKLDSARKIELPIIKEILTEHGKWHDDITKRTFSILNCGHPSEYCTCDAKPYSKKKCDPFNRHCQARKINNTVNSMCLKIYNEHNNPNAYMVTC